MGDEVFSGQLLLGERIIWFGRPAAGLLFSARDWFLVPFSFVWCGFIVNLLWQTRGVGLGTFSLIPVGMLCFGVGLMFGRFFVDAWVRRSTRYALTDIRVLIARRRPLSQFQSLRLDLLPEVQISERADGSGTVRFGPQQLLLGFGRVGFTIWLPSLDPTPQFIQITDARRVFNLVQKTSSRPA